MAGVAVDLGESAVGLAGVVVDVSGDVDGEAVADFAEGAAGAVDAVGGGARGAVRGVVSEGFHDVLLVGVREAGELLLGRKVHLAWAAGHCGGRYGSVLWSDVFVVRSGVFVLGSVARVGCGVPVSSRGAWVAG